MSPTVGISMFFMLYYRVSCISASQFPSVSDVLLLMKFLLTKENKIVSLKSGHIVLQQIVMC